MALAIEIVAVLLSSFGLLVIVANYSAMIVNLRNAERGSADKHVSLVPLLGPGLLTVCWLPANRLLGVPAWLVVSAWLLDPGTWITVHALAYWGALAMRLRTSKKSTAAVRPSIFSTRWPPAVMQRSANQWLCFALARRRGTWIETRQTCAPSLYSEFVARTLARTRVA